MKNPKKSEVLEERIAPSVPRCINVVTGVGSDFINCEPTDDVAPPHIVIDKPDGTIIEPTI